MINWEEEILKLITKWIEAKNEFLGGGAQTLELEVGYYDFGWYFEDVEISTWAEKDYIVFKKCIIPEERVTIYTVVKEDNPDYDRVVNYLTELKEEE